MALDLDPVAPAARSPLSARSRSTTSDWDRAARYLEQEQSNTQAPRASAQAPGRARQVARRDARRARARGAGLGARDRGGSGARRKLRCRSSRSTSAPKRWQQAEPLARASSSRRAGTAIGKSSTCSTSCSARCRRRSARTRRRSRPTRAANQLDLTDQETIRGIADVAFQLQDWASALTNYQKVLTALGEDEDLEPRTDVYYRLGCIKREQGQAKQAINNFEKALGLDQRSSSDARSVGRHLR